MKNKLSILLAIIIVGCNYIWADSLKYSLEPGYYSGYTTYQIGGYIDSKYGLTVFHFPVSDLKFPLNVYSLKGNIQIPINNSFAIYISGLKNISRGSGNLEDSDWLKADYEKPDIYSESSSVLDIWQYDFKFKYKIRDIFYSDNNYERYWFGIGYLSKQYDFVVNDLKQWYPREPEKEPVVQSGKVLTYRASYKIPYFEFSSECYRDKIGYGFNVGIAPSIQFEDRDDHILRSKLATGKDSGNALLLSGFVSYKLNKNLQCRLSSQYMYVYATGKQNQTRYEDTSEGQAGHIADVDHKIKNENYFVSLGLEYAFDTNNPIKDFVIEKDLNKNSQIYSSIGIGYQIFFNELESSFGPQLSLVVRDFEIGVGYFKGQNRIQTLSMGTYTTIPVYAIYKHSLNKQFSIGAGLGYSFNSNQLDPQIVSHMEYKGYQDARETINSSPFLLTSLVWQPYSNQNIKYCLQYKYDKTTVEAKNSGFTRKLSIDLSSLIFMVQVGI